MKPTATPTALRPAFARTGPGHDEDPLGAAYRRGHADGVREAAAAAERTLEEERRQTRDKVAEQIEEQSRASAREIEECQSAMVELALEAASIMLRQRIEAGDPVATRALAEALAALPDALRLRVRIEPQDLELVLAGLAETVATRGIELIEDRSIDRGGCLIETEAAGRLDATLAAAEAAVREAAGGRERSP